jgi:DNA-binding CsgD family transcriptional regulator
MPSIDVAVECFRDAAVMPERWPSALDTLSQALNSDGATLVLKATTSNSIAVSHSIAPFVPQYLSGQRIRDPREQRVNPSLAERFMPDHAYFSSQEISRDPYYQEFLVPNGFGWNATAALNGDLMVSIKRGAKRGAYDGADLAALDRALPGLRAMSRAAQLTWASGFRGQLTAFERIGRGALLLDRRGQVIDLNGCVQFGDGLDLANGVLATPRPSDAVRLRRFLAAVIDDALHGTDVRTPVLTLPRPSAKRPWLLDGIACGPAMRSLHSTAAALLLITDLHRVLRPRPTVLRQLFGLTPTESRLVRALLAGESLKQAASKIAISEGHARQRLQAIFVKTGTSRQSELMTLLARLD